MLSAVGVLGLFALLSALLPSTLLMNILNGVFFGVLTLAALIWVPGLWRAIRLKQFDRVSQLIVGIGCFMTAAVMQRGLSVIYRGLDKPVWMTDSYPFAFVIYLTIIGTVCLITSASTEEDGRWSKPELRLLMWGLPLAVAVGVATALVQET